MSDKLTQHVQNMCPLRHAYVCFICAMLSVVLIFYPSHFLHPAIQETAERINNKPCVANGESRNLSSRACRGSTESIPCMRRGKAQKVRVCVRKCVCMREFCCARRTPPLPSDAETNGMDFL